MSQKKKTIHFLTTVIVQSILYQRRPRVGRIHVVVSYEFFIQLIYILILIFNLHLQKIIIVWLWEFFTLSEELIRIIYKSLSNWGPIASTTFRMKFW